MKIKFTILALLAGIAFLIPTTIFGGFANTRLLSKPDAASELRGDTQRRTAVYSPAHDDSNNVSTKQFTDAVGFGKKSTEELYCSESGGLIEEMSPEFNTSQGRIKGVPHKFCTFYIDQGILQIGLEAFANENPSIAATLIKTTPEITEDSALFEGTYDNPSHNVCKNLGGTMISFVLPGSFTNTLGESDICVFGDSSMVSGWSLIYMANHREGYDAIKNKVKAYPLSL